MPGLSAPILTFRSLHMIDSQTGWAIIEQDQTLQSPSGGTQVISQERVLRTPTAAAIGRM